MTILNMKICRICGKRGDRISEFLGVCVDRIGNNSEDTLKITYEAHKFPERDLD